MRRLLFVTPAVPAPSRSGLRMRGWLFLNGLAREHRVTLLAGSPLFPNETEADVAALGDLVEQAIVLRFRMHTDPTLLARRVLRRIRGAAGPRDWVRPTAAMRRRIALLRDQHFDLIHVFRLYMLPLAVAAIDEHGQVPWQLDVDDWESKTRSALAAIAERSDSRQAARLRNAAGEFERCEEHWLPRMSQCFVCSSEDAAGIATRFGLSRISIVENAVPQPLRPPPPPRSDMDELLFVGSLGYLANDDAVRFLLDHVVPRLRRALPRPFRLIVAGAGASRSLRNRLRQFAEVEWAAAPEHIEPFYERARLVLAPVRAGGGTRIKVLEAFAQGRPVVASGAAVAGLAVHPEVHYASAESPAQWAERIRELIAAPERCKRLVAAASDWLGHHSFDAGVERVASLSRKSVFAGRPAVADTPPT